ncbi:Hypothetical predicted protein [Cloeon dipterum]|uniref:DNA-directed primase/polymerase protein n=1 Tax=Cloeon dipterum TaxID=197152 RepID=A0A8S1CP80_9INSE|nr:Hypothetical predicted protein [Cloeon dipterum]
MSTDNDKIRMDRKRSASEMEKVDVAALLQGITAEDFDDDDEEEEQEKKYESEINVDLERCYFKYLQREAEVNTMHSALDAESRRWRFFRKQADLLDCFKEHRALNVMPFVYHDALRSTRTFVLVHPLELLYRTKDRTQNYFYEIIAEGVPSKLYLDLEFDKKANPDVDGEKMTNTVIELFVEHLNSKLNLSINSSSVVDLDSSTEVKFSRHVIFNTFFSFKDNSVVGALVRNVTQEGQHPQLRVRKKDGGQTCIVDLCVYTKNRHFRILGSTKFCRKAPLVLSDGANQTLSLQVTSGRLRDEVLFLSSLVTGSNNPILPYNVLATVQRPKPMAVVEQAKPESFSGMPRIDAFFQHILSPVGLQKILSYPRGYVVYSSGPSGYCLNKGAAHQRHRVYWVLAKRLGVYYQKCGDKSDCGDFRSPKQLLPEHLLLEARGPLDPWELCLSGPTSNAPLQLTLPT